MSDFDHREMATHYQTLLAPVYAWMVGDLVNARAAAAADLVWLGVGAPAGKRRALDLGAGIGLHAVPMAAMGYDVTAIDSSPELLAELSHASPRVTTICADLLAVADHVAGPFDVIVCMGDTLTHLASEAAVRRALESAARLLAPDGILAITVRDYTRPRRGAERFFLVRADDSRVLTCCLDYEDTRVAVTDILHERDSAGWRMRTSSYHKLRLTGPGIASVLQELGLTVTRADADAGWITVVARGAHPRR